MMAFDEERDNMEEKETQLDRIETSVKRTEQAVFGDVGLGLPGLVNDMEKMKSWRSGLALRTAGVVGIITGSIVGTKALFTKFFENKL